MVLYPLPFWLLIDKSPIGHLWLAKTSDCPLCRKHIANQSVHRYFGPSCEDVMTIFSARRPPHFSTHKQAQNSMPGVLCGLYIVCTKTYMQKHILRTQGRFETRAIAEPSQTAFCKDLFLLNSWDSSGGFERCCRFLELECGGKKIPYGSGSQSSFMYKRVREGIDKGLYPQGFVSAAFLYSPS